MESEEIVQFFKKHIYPKKSYLDALVIIIIIIIIMMSFTSFLSTHDVFSKFNPEILMEKYTSAHLEGGFLSDEELYALAGWIYIHGSDPIDINFEHPPLAKYFIGLSILLFGNPVWMSIIFSIATLLILYVISKKSLRIFPFTVLPVLILGLDKLYVKFSYTSMLDIYVTFFVILTIFLLLHSLNALKYLPLTYVALGLALSCKWTAIFLIPSMFIYYIIMRKWNHVKLFPLGLLLTIGVYMGSYTMFFMYGNGLIDFMNIQFKMYQFQHFMRYERGTPPPFWILLNLLGGIEGPAEHRTITIMANNTLLYGAPSYGLSIIHEYNPFTWPLSVSASILYLLNHFILRKPNRINILFPICFFASLLMASYGQIFIWYILPSLPLGFLALSSFLKEEYQKLSNRKTAKILLLAYIGLLIIFRFIKLPSFIPLNS